MICGRLKLLTSYRWAGGEAIYWRLKCVTDLAAAILFRLETVLENKAGLWVVLLLVIPLDCTTFDPWWRVWLVGEADNLLF